ncbi:MAG TPA: DNA-directed RNA polymerase subunit RpoH/Rpb5 C-terminal domain-containing protein [Candidatus Saccharimonadales bacterium]|nr:DNA-directed RNA polymerase subunit RpoH/Rpb5 C-terminal domain-containing protein [Candidatus Saccharimonadales bacterium]
MDYELERLWRIKQNQIKMLNARGFYTIHEDWILDDNLTSKEFKRKLGNNNNNKSIRKLLYSKYEKQDSKNIVVYYVGLENSKQIKVDSIRECTEAMTNHNMDGILIINSTLSTEALKHTNYITEQQLQIFTEDELLINITEHVFQPLYFPMTMNESNDYKKEHGKNKLPGLLLKDPVAKYFNLKVGQIIITHTDCYDDMLTVRIEHVIVIN